MTAIIEPNLTRDAARALTDEIKVRVTDLLPLIRQAFQRRADKALGYETWADYCRAELSDIRVPVVDRPDAITELNELGMSQRQISDALGISNATVSRHLRPSVTEVTDEVRSLPSGAVPVPAEEEERPLPGMPLGQERGEAFASGVDDVEAAMAAEPERPSADVPLFADDAPERPRPPKWDPEDRKRHEAEVARKRDVEAARDQSKTIVTDVLTAVCVVVAGCRYGETGLVTKEMITKLREAIDLLEGEL